MKKKKCVSGYMLLLYTACMALIGCYRDKPDDEKGAKACAEEFAEDFFNFKYKEARGLCSDSSALWLDFFVSNITRDDVDSIRMLTIRPVVEISCVEKGADDTTAFAYCKVRHAYVLDTLGHSGHMADEVQYKIPMIRENGKWKIKMEDLLQSEK